MKLRFPILLLALAGSLAIATPAVAVTPVAPANGAQFEDAGTVRLTWTLDPGESGTERIEWSRKPDIRPDGAFVAAAGGEGNETVGDVNSYELDMERYGTYYWHVQSFTGAATTWGPTFSFTNVEPPAAKTKPVRQKPLTRAQLARRRAEKRAARAVVREIRFDYGRDVVPSVDCSKAGRNRYSCDINVNYWEDGTFTGQADGSARVTQRGSRYSVDYRIHW